MQGVVSVLNNPTVEKLRHMKLKVMAQMLSEPDPSLRELSFEERLGIMVEKEWLAKKNARIKRLLNSASLGLNACLEDIDYNADRTIDKKIIQTLSTCTFIEQKLNIVIPVKQVAARLTSPVPSAIMPAGMAIQLNILESRNSCWKFRMLRMKTGIPSS